MVVWLIDWLIGLVDLVESSNTLEDTFSQALQEFRDGHGHGNDDGSNGSAAAAVRKSMQ